MAESRPAGEMKKEEGNGKVVKGQVSWEEYSNAAQMCKDRSGRPRCSWS